MKFNRSNKIFSGLALAAILAITGIVGFAQQQSTQEQKTQRRSERQWGRGKGGDEGRRGLRGGFGGHMFEGLNLSDAQKEQMKQIATRYRESFKAKRGRGAARGDRSSLLTDGTFNEAAVRAAAQARANERVEMEVGRARMMHELYSVLTAEQKAQLATARQQREQKRQEWRSRRGTGAGQNQ